MRSTITTHFLDTRLGKPAAGIAATLEIRRPMGLEVLAQGVTDEDGRIPDFLTTDALSAGVYQVKFETGAYFRAAGIRGFYPEVKIVFEVEAGAGHYHVPLLLSPFGYSTYRGS